MSGITSRRRRAEDAALLARFLALSPKAETYYGALRQLELAVAHIDSKILERKSPEHTHFSFELRLHLNRQHMGTDRQFIPRYQPAESYRVANKRGFAFCHLRNQVSILDTRESECSVKPQHITGVFPFRRVRFNEQLVRSGLPLDYPLQVPEPPSFAPQE